MSRKAIIICAAVAAVLFGVVAAAVAVLYSGKNAGARLGEKYELMAAVPVDAVAVMRFDSVDDMTSLLTDASSLMSPFVRAYAGSPFVDFLSGLHEMSEQGILPRKSSPAVVSYHYDGELVPLAVFDAGKASEDVPAGASALLGAAEAAGLSSCYIDCSGILDSDAGLYGKGLVAVSPSEDLIESSRRHLSRKLSVIDSRGFADAASEAEGGNLILLSCGEADKLTEEILVPKYRKYNDFLSDVSEWLAFTICSAEGGHLALKAGGTCQDGGDDFLSVLEAMPGAVSSVSSMVPSYAVSVVSVPFQDAGAYLSEYDRFRDSRSSSSIFPVRDTLGKYAGIGPEKWCRALAVKEAAAVSFHVGQNLESALLLKVGNPDVSVIFRGTDVSTLDNYAPQVHRYAYKGFAASLFGPLFRLEDESAFTYINGWIVSGSRAAVKEYVSGRALENTLGRYMADAGLPDRLSVKGRCLVAYFSPVESRLEKIFSPAFASAMESAADGFSYMPLVFSVGKTRSSMDVLADLDRVVVTKSKAPAFERDTVIDVPDGPFRVKNSGTGRMNLFYQQDNMYLCLQEEDGRGIWGVPFSSPICGRAGTIDYFANGKLQILFASGSKLYLIDRLGRYVNPFPVDLGKKIVLGPDIYDFNGTRRYNVMVLHDDNTVAMYNLKGNMPPEWKGITAGETIKGLPEPLKVAGKTYWVVRTSVQTLIFPFYGGEPYTAGTGDKMIRTDSKVIPAEGNSVTVTCYDGKERIVDL